MSTEEIIAPQTVNIEKFSVVLVDIAGTTTSISFVQDELFPFVTKQVEDFLKSQWDEESVKEAVKHLKSNEELDVVKTVDLVKKLTEEKSDNKGLKQIQGLIYKKGYTEGTIKGHVFADVSESFEMWSKTKKIAIYSTGSVESQKLLFANSVNGDLSKYISDYFDQIEIGNKNDAESYKKIAEKLTVKLDEIVFITDNADEAKAAKSAGAFAVLITRAGNADVSEGVKQEYSVIASFKDLLLENAAKRKIPEEVVNNETPPTKVPKTEETTNTEEDKSEKVSETKPETMEVDEEKMQNEQIESVINAFIDEEAKKMIQESEKKTEEAQEKVEENEAIEDEKESKKEDPKTESEKENEDKVNGESAENGEMKTVEEKENKSVLANGVENGAKAIEATEESAENGAQKMEENEDVKKDETECKTDETDKKAKKMEESATEKKKSVSVEV